MSTPSLSKDEAIRKIVLDALERVKGKDSDIACKMLRSSLEAIVVVTMIEEKEK